MADEEKNIPASDRKIEKAREEGQVATSRELISALSLGAGMLALFYLLPDVGGGIWQVTNFCRNQAIRGHFTLEEVLWVGSLVSWSIGVPIATVLLASNAVAIMGGLAMTSFNFTLQPLEPKFTSLDIVSGFQRLFLSQTPWINMLKGVVISLLLLWGVWSAVEDKVSSILVLGSRPVDGQMQYLKAITSSVLQRTMPIALGIGILDLIYQRWHLANELMMSVQEVKDEHRQSEGDPHVKSKRKQRARQLAFRQNISKVAQADVVVVNPTHYAVALRYRREENAAPIVLARGLDHIALQIRTEARKNDVLVVENRPLARALYAKSQAGMPVPREFYAPVAEVLAIVYRKRKARLQRKA